MSLIELRGIGLEVASPVRTRVLHPIDLDVVGQHSLVIMGPSGAGKTTLASIIGALQPPSEGSLRFAGHELAGSPGRQLSEFRRAHVGFVFQQSHLIDERSTLANVELGIVDPALNRAERRAAAMESLGMVGLATLAGRRAAHLSGGERHRVAVARALVKSPSLVIADEPTAALDQHNGQAVLELLRQITDLGSTLIIVTHDVRAASMADDVVTIVDGRRE